MLASLARATERHASQPVSREARMRRLADAGSSGDPAADPRERLKRANHALDEWSATRSNKSLWQSWMCACSPNHRC